MTPNFIDDIVFAVNSSDIRSRFREGIDIFGSWDTDVKVSDFIAEKSNGRQIAVFPLTHGYFQIFFHEYATGAAYITFSYTVPALGRYYKVLHGDAISRSVTLLKDDQNSSDKIRKMLIKKLNSLADAACEFHSKRIGNVNVNVNSNAIKATYQPIYSLNYVISALAKVKVAVANSKLRFDELNFDDDMLQELNSEVDRLQEMVLNEIRSDPSKYIQGVKINVF